MALIIDETNKQQLQDVLGITDLAAKVKALEDAKEDAQSAQSQGSDT